MSTEADLLFSTGIDPKGANYDVDKLYQSIAARKAASIKLDADSTKLKASLDSINAKTFDGFSSNAKKSVDDYIKDLTRAQNAIAQLSSKRLALNEASKFNIGAAIGPAIVSSADLLQEAQALTVEYDQQKKAIEAATRALQDYNSAPIDAKIDNASASPGSDNTDKPADPLEHLFSGDNLKLIETGKQALTDMYGNLASDTDEATQAVIDYVDALDIIAEQTEQVSEKSESALSGTEEKLDALLSVEKLEAFRGWLGDFKDGFGIVGKEFLGLSAREAQAITATGDLIEKGIAVGSAFGLAGGIAGASLGLISGYILDIIKASDEKRAAMVADFRAEEKAIYDNIEALRKYREGFNVQAGSGHFKKTLDDLDKFRTENTVVYEQVTEDIKKYEEELRNIGEKEWIIGNIPKLIAESKDAAEVFNHIQQLQANKAQLDMEMLARAKESTAAAMFDALEIGNEASRSMDTALQDMADSEKLAAMSNADLEQSIKDNKKAMDDASKSTADWRTKLLDVQTLVTSGKFDDAAKLVKDAVAWINFNTSSFDEANKKLKASEAELAGRRSSNSQKANQEKNDLLGYISDLTRAADTARGEISRVDVSSMLYVDNETKESISQTEQNILDLTVSYSELQKKRGESDKDYIERTKAALGLSKNATAQQVKDAIEVEIASIDSLNASLVGQEDYASRVQESEAKKVAYIRKLREIELEEARQAHQEKLAMVDLELSASTESFNKSLEKLPALYSVNGDIISNKELEIEAIQEIIDEKERLLLSTAKTESERIKIERDSTAERAALEKDLSEYKKALLDDYTAKLETQLQPIVDISNSAIDTIYDNLANSKKATDGLPTALRKTVSDMLKEKAKLWIGEGVGESAAALASLAIGDFKGAGLHGASAAGYFAAAALAGYAGAKLQPKNEDQAKEPKPTGERSSGSSEFQTRELAPVNVYMTGPNGTLVIPTSDPRELASFGAMVSDAVAANQASQGH